jgi:hypothetical protein
MTTSASIVLVYDGGDGSDCGNRIVVEANKTSVEEGGEVVFTAYSACYVDAQKIKMKASDGYLGQTTRGISSLDRKTDTVQLANSNFGTTTYPIGRIESVLAASTIYYWPEGVEQTPENIRIAATRGSSIVGGVIPICGSKFRINNNWISSSRIYGFLKINYYPGNFVRAFHWDAPVKVDDDTPFLFFVYFNDLLLNTISITVTDSDGSGAIIDPDPDDDPEEPTIKSVLIVVSDICSEAKLSNATVYIDGTNRGKTNVNGELLLNLAKGTHTIRCTRTDYIATDDDQIDNEEFTVS